MTPQVEQLILDGLKEVKEKLDNLAALVMKHETMLCPPGGKSIGNGSSSSASVWAPVVQNVALWTIKLIIVALIILAVLAGAEKLGLFIPKVLP